MQPACIPRVLMTEKFLFSNSYSPRWEKVGIIHTTKESFTSTSIVTGCQLSYDVILFYGKWRKIGRRDYDFCTMFDGAVWKIPVKLSFPGSTEQVAVYARLVRWHCSVLYCMQPCYRHVRMKHTSASWEAWNWRQANRLTMGETVTEWLHQSWFYQKQSYNVTALNGCCSKSLLAPGQDAVWGLHHSRLWWWKSLYRWNIMT